ncbi:30S ribosomal protein S20 [Magnetofaba australis]|uniref:Small ribosomal subunit protein bS20 n=1 Tax=Magnetofaba australis IT-1 TaxID=1434232 RepID=A0A1Y2K831_9PROT|nr:30S ribosomal protein S20 [Magnetofaba australis]OSM06789.1 putative 30S ribosomal protein S20 [Magnetofaba australis IT-1]
MANHKSALKRIRQTAKRTERNSQAKAHMRTITKRVATAVEAGDVDQAKSSLQDAISVLDLSAKKGIIHKNQASRRVKRLNARVKKMVTAGAAA